MVSQMSAGRNAGAHKMERFFTKIATRISGIAGRPLAFVIALLIVIIWGTSGPIFRYSDTWQLVINTGTTIVTFLMVFLIQNSQNRDAGAMQAKLDEMLRALDKAREGFIGIEHMTDTEIERLREALERECGQRAETGKATTGDDTVERLLKRL
jgi:low affinity Fe/Cu permease